jgi:Flp pilus assembly protein TadG
MVSMLGMAGLTIDVGHAYVVRAQLQGGTNAAALAAATTVYNTGTTLTNEAKAFDSSSGEANTNPYATGTPTIEPICVQALEMNGATCSASSQPNAVLVKQTASVPTTFLNVVGIKSMPIQTTALASMAGPANPWNVAIIMDGTGSMNDADTECAGASTQFECATYGIQSFLAAIKPCPAGGPTCKSDSTSQFHVALFYFPNILTTSTGQGDLLTMNSCKAGTYTEPAPFQVYTLPKEAATSYAPMTYTQGATTWTASYEVTYGASDADVNGFVSDYYDPASTSTGGLNPSSSIVQAIGYGAGTKAGCLTISPGGINLNGALGTPTSTTIVNKANVGEGITYYASVIYAAQSALIAESKLYANSQNAIIFLSDGESNTQWIYFPQGTLTQTPSQDTAQPSTISSTLGYSTLKTTANTSAKGAYYVSSVSAETTGTISGVYPDFIDECQQAIVASQFAQNSANANATVYAIAYGSTNSGCGNGSHPDDYTDITTVATGKNVSFTASTLTPCITMQDIASTSSDFYGVQQSGSGDVCTSSSNPLTTMASAWQNLVGQFVSAKLLPINVTYVVTTAS